MVEPEHAFLKSVELRLLRCTISGDPSFPTHYPSSNPSNPLVPLIDDLLGSIERGDYAAALSAGAARLVFPFIESWEFENSTASAERLYGQMRRCLDAFLCDGAAAEDAWLRVLESDDGDDTEYRVAIVLCIGVSALLAFVQQNVTGPVGKFSPFPLLFQQSGKDEDVENGGEWDRWARIQLTSVGCDVLGKVSHLQYLEYAKVLLMKTKESCTRMSSCSSAAKSISWWLCRLILLQQRILDELSSSLYNLLQVFKKETLLQFGVMKNVITYWGMVLDEKEALTIVSMVQIEGGLIEYYYGRIDSSRLHFMNAAEAFGMDISVTGVLGFRTVHQVDAKPQLVLVTNTGQQLNDDGSIESSSLGGNPDNLDQQGMSSPFDDNIIQPINSVASSMDLSQVQPNVPSHEKGLNFQSHGHYECDILMTPRLVQNANSDGDNSVSAIIGSGTMLTAIQQVIILAQCLHHQRSRRDDELSSWEMAPYIEAIDSQQKSYQMIRFSCDIMRIRWESTRSRTKPRALFMMDKLVKAFNESFPVAAKRMQLSFVIYIPTIPSLRKEYGELSLGCGMVGEALKIFEDLELWDNLIYCYRLLDKRAAAVDLINARLCQTPTDPKLWCSLGDVTNIDSCYEKALEVSNNKSARAMRSLARSAYNKSNYEMSKSLWESAMALNSLYPDGWFALGAAALKARDIERAVDGFTRAVQLDPENGEAWNNIACLHMINKKSKPAFIAFKEALKFRRNNWQLWENFSHVALDIGNLRQALEAIKMVLDLSLNKRVDTELLDKIMTKIEENGLKTSLCRHASNAQDISASQEDSIKGSCKDPENVEISFDEREWDMLLAMIGGILQQVIKSGSCGEEIWGLFARWHKLKGNLSMCAESLLKQVRAYQGSDLWQNLERFRKFSQASLLLCEVYMQISSSTGSRRELVSAELHLRNSVKQAVNFSETEECRDLQACLNQVRKQLDTVYE